MLGGVESPDAVEGVVLVVNLDLGGIEGTLGDHLLAVDFDTHVNVHLRFVGLSWLGRCHRRLGGWLLTV